MNLNFYIEIHRELSGISNKTLPHGQCHLGYFLIPSQQRLNSSASIALEDFQRCLLQISCSHARVNKRSTRENITVLLANKTVKKISHNFTICLILDF